MFVAIFVDIFSYFMSCQQEGRGSNHKLATNTTTTSRIYIYDKKKGRPFVM